MKTAIKYVTYLLSKMKNINKSNAEQSLETALTPALL